LQFHDDDAYWMVEDFAGNRETPGARRPRPVS
jgi:hypothetical protein